jgi:hypothetical protein
MSAARKTTTVYNFSTSPFFFWLQALSYLILGLILIQIFFSKDLSMGSIKFFVITLHLMFLCLSGILFPKSIRIVLNSYVSFLFIVGIFFQNRYENRLEASFKIPFLTDVIIVGYDVIAIPLLILVPWLFLIKTFLTRYESKIGKFTLLLIMTIFCFWSSFVLINFFFET